VGEKKFCFHLVKYRKGRQYLKTIKHNLSLQKATFKPLFSSGRCMAAGAPHQHFTTNSNYCQSKLKKILVLGH
jgi:predicted glycosyltransferase involved in capsule biosynthesis